MKPLIVLLTVFLLALFGTWAVQGQLNYIFSGNLAMSLMLLFTAIGHFAFPEGMMLMVPQFFPFKKMLVYLTGLIEIGATIGLMIPSLRHLTGICLIIFFIILLPANINAAVYKVDYQKATYTGPGLKYLWFRVPLQLLFMCWTWYFSL
jgi:uncharacterized membrane protein